MDFFDIQFNGCGGVNFTSATLTREEVRTVVQAAAASGLGGFCPTVITADFATIRHAFATLAAAECATMMPAFHLEGPYISPLDGYRGAHPVEHVRSPCWDEFRRWQDAAGGRIRLVTLAPETAGAIGFIAKLTAANVVVALGHTAATGDEIRAAVEAGAKLSTHLGNGCAALLPRHENAIWEQLAEDRLWASVIADGQHLTPAVLACILRVKSPMRTILTSDASPLAGVAPGQYELWGKTLDVLPTRRIVVSGTPYLAGSYATLPECARYLHETCGVSWPDVVQMACVNPRKLLGLPAF